MEEERLKMNVLSIHAKTLAKRLKEGKREEEHENRN